MRRAAVVLALLAMGCSDSSGSGAVSDTLQADIASPDAADDDATDAPEPDTVPSGCQTADDCPAPTCYVPACTAGECNTAPAELGTDCEEDGDPCTIERCDAVGTCQLAGVDDDNPACRDTPRPCGNDAGCDDGDPCTLDVCTDGRCGFVPTTEVCGSGFDEDCDGDIDCQDTDCEDTEACIATCEPVGTLDCGVAEAVSSSRGEIQSWSCASKANLPGAEVVLSFVAPQTGAFQWRVTPEPTGLITLLALSGECRVDACIASATTAASEVVLSFEASAGDALYLVADSEVGGIVNLAAHEVLCEGPEICGNGVDDDLDTALDCFDTDCQWIEPCQPSESICDDGIDNDADTRTDCEDENCQGQPACTGVEGSCDDTIDGDGDGQTDCEDSDCEDAPACDDSAESDCEDGVDNDDDGTTDCDDFDCVAQGCPPPCLFKAQPITCGGTLGLVQTFYATLDGYACTEAATTGGDVVLALPEGLSGTIQLTGNTQPGNRIVLLEGSCSAESCTAEYAVDDALGDFEVAFELTGADPRFVVIEGAPDSEFSIVSPITLGCP